MQLGMVGLGRMGANMAKRLMKAGHECAVFDLDPKRIQELGAEGAKGAPKVEDFKTVLKAPRAIWVMVPSGEATEGMVKSLIDALDPGDIIIDGGNSFYKDDVRRSKLAKEKGIHYVDAGTSGGVWGFERGYCLMIGGEKEIVEHLDPIFKSLAPGPSGVSPTPGRDGKSTAEQGYLYCGPSGAGHFAKMVHNGIEYGLMQAYAEGLDILKNKNSEALEPDMRYDINLADLTETWRRGSVIGSWLLDLTAMALIEDAQLSKFTGFVQDSGEGRWTIEAAIEEAVPVDVLAAALFVRFRSRQEHTFAEKLLSAMRSKFGGHVELHAPGK
jgi:6-phosphogluconate dehydrogenase